MKIKKNRRSKANGFTLIELLVVISIIVLLTTVVLLALASARAKSRDAQRKQDAATMRKALELYFSTNNIYPNGAPLTNTDQAYDFSNLSNFLVPNFINSIPFDPKSSLANYQYAWTNSGKDYSISIPFGNDGGTTCKFTTPGGTGLMAGIPICTYQN